MQKQVKILIVEDDENLRFLIGDRLQSEGYEVIETGNGDEAEKIILEQKPYIVLLDWMLPGTQGSEVCASVRKAGFSNLIIMMTAKSQDIDKIEAYSFGVSDYITKPFNMDVLIALLESKVKYYNSNGNDTLVFGDIQHHPNIHTLTKGDKKIELTILENRILLYFLQHVGKVIGRDELMQVVWGYSSNVNTRTLDMHIVRLRKKIENNPDKPLFLQTVRGLGYKFVDERNSQD
ncbi:response regulator transcription factor [Olivibacter sitiensis]|uniref:response regulator transcription factor n=1 Tax=Olivibacter sitiensis TaxID=376470 RepID=UPI00040A1D89|nr:response regulator transcription factor [Olivibacter sitiensis]